MPCHEGDPILFSCKERRRHEKRTTRYPDGSVRLLNPHIERMEQDILYHLALGSKSHDLQEMFGDVRFVCMGGTPKRMEKFAYYIMDEIGYKLPTGTTLLDISLESYRYCMFKVGPVLCLSHGMGIPSASILLHEVIKLMYHSKCKDPLFFRLGTCGGIGIPGGNLVITDSAVDGLLQPFLELPVLGKLQRRPAILDRQLCSDLQQARREADPFGVTIGKTMCTYDFYEGQGRLDGAFCEYEEEDKNAFLRRIHKAGVVNMEMESLCFAAMCHHAGIRCAVVCVTLLDRLQGDQVATSRELLDEWQEYPQILVSRLIKKQLNLSEDQARSQTVRDPQQHLIVRRESASFE